jgi:hypothetical protein
LARTLLSADIDHRDRPTPTYRRGAALFLGLFWRHQPDLLHAAGVGKDTAPIAIDE